MSVKRIQWIDISKAIAIILMIIGHVLPYGSEVRNLIFSFHMPLFFILTGYTIKGTNNFKDLGKQIIKDFKKIYIPCIITQFLNILISFFINGGNFFQLIRTSVEQIFWASAVNVNTHPSLGALWFLVALFWTKSLYSLMNVILQHQNKGIVFLFLALIGRILSKYIWLPQSMDVVLVAVLFIYIGHVMKEYSNILQKNQMILTIGCFSLWMISWEYGIYIEMGTRSYPLFIICIVEAICGCFCVISLSQVIEACTRLTRISMVVGQHTLFLLCVHHIEWNFSNYWSNKTTVALCIIRMIYALGGLIVLLAIKKMKKDLLGK